jgi:hypothetical protein
MEGGGVGGISIRKCYIFDPISVCLILENREILMQKARASRPLELVEPPSWQAPDC